MITAEHLETFMAHLDSLDARAATELALTLADDGATLPELFSSLVAPAQAEVGRRWACNAYGVADEHAATAIVDIVVAVLTTQVPPGAAGGPQVALTCPEGEWHLLPARLTVEVLRWGGCPTTFLGGSMPAAHLARFLATSPAEVVAISCTTPLAFAGVRAAIEVAHDAGRPAMVGGRAMGSDDRRARALGADLWAPDATAALELLHAPLPDALSSAKVDHVPPSLTGRRSEIVDRALADLAAGLPEYAAYDDAQRQRTAEDLAHLVDLAAAALLVDDPSVLTDAVLWLDEVLRHRGVPAGVLERSLAALDPGIEEPALAALLAAGRARLLSA